RRRTAGEQVLRERRLRLHRDAVLPAAQASLPRRQSRAARTPATSSHPRPHPGPGMNLQASPRVTVAPRFHLPFQPGERIQLSAGIEEHEGRYYPRLPWRNATAEELALLAGEPANRAAPDALLFRLPEHLIARWWKLVESAQGPLPDGLGEFDSFVNAVRDF